MRRFGHLLAMIACCLVAAGFIVFSFLSDQSATAATKRRTYAKSVAKLLPRSPTFNPNLTTTYDPQMRERTLFFYNPRYVKTLALAHYRLLFVQNHNGLHSLEALGFEQVIFTNGDESWIFHYDAQQRELKLNNQKTASTSSPSEGRYRLFLC